MEKVEKKKALLERLELPTPALGRRRSIQLSYSSKCVYHSIPPLKRQRIAADKGAALHTFLCLTNSLAQGTLCPWMRFVGLQMLYAPMSNG